MVKLPQVKASRVRTVLERDGWRVIRQTGSHAIFARADGTGRAIVPIHDAPLPEGTLRSIIAQAGMTAVEFLRKL